MDKDYLWQLNTGQHLIKNGSSAQQVLQYRILSMEEKDNARK